MVEKPSKLLATAKELISNQKLSDAVIICEKVIKNDPNNINGLLLATKCWMDLDVKPDSVKSALEKVLILKPLNSNAIQGLRKFYEKYLESYFIDGVTFYRNLFQSNELNEKDYELITNVMVKIYNDKEAENFIWEYLESRINNQKDVNSLMILFQIAAENLIVYDNDRNRFDQFVNLLSIFDTKIVSCDDNEIDFLRAMETLFKAYLDDMKPDYFYTLLEKNDSSVYGYLLFAKLVCEHYLFDDCQDTIRLGLSKLETNSLVRPKPVRRAFEIIEITNLIHSFNIDLLKSVWPKEAIEIVPKSIWCQSYAIGFDVFAHNELTWLNISEDWCREMSKSIEILCQFLMEGITSSRLIEDDHQIIMNAELSSFQFYLWSRVMKEAGLLDKHQESLNKGLQCKHVFYQIHAELAYISISKNDFKTAGFQFLDSLNAHFCPTILEHFVDMHMSLQQYAEPIEIFDKLDIDQCTESLLEKFVLCLDKLERLKDAIATSQRLVKYYPNKGENWQFLGDLYLKRGSINNAYAMYMKSKELLGETSEIFSRFGNVFSMKYEQTYNENDFAESVKFFNKSLDLCPSVEAVEGQASVHYLHGERSLKQLVLSCSINDVKIVSDLLIKYDYLIKENEFQMNLMGKIIFLSILGNIYHIIDLSEIAHFLSMSEEAAKDPYEISFRCFQISIQKFNRFSEPYFNYAMLCLLKLNKLNPNNQHDDAVNSELFQKAENHFKSALYLNVKHSEAWKYLGYLYFRHGPIHQGIHVLNIQHCLSTSINLSGTADFLKDPEAAFLLGLLYIRENWCPLAKDLFLKIQMDHHANPIGYIGMYLLAVKDHTISEQMEISKAIMCYNYRDEDSNSDDNYYRINDSIVGLFCENLGFLVNSQCDYNSFDTQEKQVDLISALKTALIHVWTKFEAYNNLKIVLSVDKEKQYREYGCFLGILELLTGNYQLGKLLIKKSKLSEDPNLDKLFKLLELDKTWRKYNKDNSYVNECVDKLRKVAKKIGLSIYQNIQESSDQDLPQPALTIDELILTAIVQYMSSCSNLPATLNLGIKMIRATYDKSDLTVGLQSSILSLSTIILLSQNSSIADKFIEMIDHSLPNIDDTIENLPQVLARLKAFNSCHQAAWQYLLNNCIKQPYDMNRWLNLLEFGLEFIDNLDGFVTISHLFFLTNRPWCFSTFDTKRYATILHRYSTLLTPGVLLHHRHMVMKAMKLFPHLCLEFSKFFCPTN